MFMNFYNQTEYNKRLVFFNRLNQKENQWFLTFFFNDKLNITVL